MMRLITKLLPALVLFCLALPGNAETIRLSTLEWPPFVGKDLPEEGMNAALVRTVLAALGHTLELDFLPWKRAINDAAQGRTHGYLPEYPSAGNAEIEASFACSESIGESVVGLAQNRQAPIVWSSVADLDAYSVGVVDGYLNEAAFDQRVAEGRIKVEVAKSDILNLRKVAMGRMPLAVVDRAVMDYLLVLDRRDNGTAHPVLEFNAKPLGVNSLHVCFSRARDGIALRDAFNAGLAAIDVAAHNHTYLSTAKF